MTKTILITGSTDGIGFETAKALAAQNHTVLLHGRSEAKLHKAEQQVLSTGGSGKIEKYVADLSLAAHVQTLGDEVAARNDHLDVLINNAGVFTVADTITKEGLDVRFMVNTIAPYMLTRRLLPILRPKSRIINLSSAAQAPVELAALSGNKPLNHGEAYAQSKLAITMWTTYLAKELGTDGPVAVSVNPGSFLGTKMVKEAYGSAGKDIEIGSKILTQAATSDAFATASGLYYDNDSGRFTDPHPDALDDQKNTKIVKRIETIISALTSDQAKDK